jgi:molybdopterin-guanine dinucleotide biosynthesis protein A
MTEVVGCILAGGLARRMGGGDKGLIRLGGRLVLDHVLDRLEPQVNQIVLNANGDPSRFAGYGLPVVADSIEGFAGPLAGVLAGLDWAHDNTDAQWVATAATDTPFFPADFVTRMLDGIDGRRGRHGVRGLSRQASSGVRAVAGASGGGPCAMRFGR